MKNARYSKALVYSWEVVKQLFFLMIVFGAFGKADSGFESVVLAGILIIYLKIDMLAWAQGQLGYNLAKDMSLGFGKLDSEKKYQEVMESAVFLDERFQAVETKKLYIRSFFATIYVLMAIAALL